MLSTSNLWANTFPPEEKQVMGIISKMETAYARVTEYPAEIEVSGYQDGQIVDAKKFCYTFKKPNHLPANVDLYFRQFFPNQWGNSGHGRLDR